MDIIELVIRYLLLFVIKGLIKSTIIVVESRNILSLTSKGFRERDKH
jgi:hypothetical protein